MSYKDTPETFAYPSHLERRLLHFLVPLPEALMEVSEWIKKENIREENIYSIEINVDREGCGTTVVFLLSKEVLG